MTVAPLVELIAVLVITALGFAPFVSDMSMERGRSVAGAVANQLGSVAVKAQQFCDYRNCATISLANIVAAGYISAAQSASFNGTITVVPNGTSFTVASSRAIAPAIALDGYNDVNGAPALGTGSLLCYTPAVGSVYKTATTC